MPVPVGSWTEPLCYGEGGLCPLTTLAKGSPFANLLVFGQNKDMPHSFSTQVSVGPNDTRLTNCPFLRPAAMNHLCCIAICDATMAKALATFKEFLLPARGI